MFDSHWSVRYWNVQSPDFCFPEISDPQLKYQTILDRPNSGIAISGGGTVSASLIMGYFKALQELGLLDKIRYISGVSGGSWGSAPFCYLPNHYDDNLYLGPKFQPAQITEEILAATPSGSMSAAVCQAEIINLCIKEMLLPPPHTAYCRAVGDIFLTPFGIESRGKFFSCDDNAVQNILARNPKLAASDFQTLKSGRPYPIINGSLMAPTPATGANNYPFEFTPLYVGMLPLQSGAGSQGQSLGGTLVEPFGFDTQAPTSLDGSYATVPARTLYKFTLADSIGTSGAAIEQKIISMGLANVVFPQFQYWNPQAFDGKSISYNFGDGGIVEDTGVAALLARKVANIAVFLTEPLDKTTYGGFGYDQIAGLFGQPLSNGQAANPHLQVFSSSDFQALVNGVGTAKAAGGPVMFQANYQVQANSWLGVPAYSCQILWVFNDRASSWTNQLPQGIRSQIGQSGGELDTFPFVEVFNQNKPHMIQLTPKQANMLGNLGYWMVQNQAARYSALLG